MRSGDRCYRSARTSTHREIIFNPDSQINDGMRHFAANFVEPMENNVPSYQMHGRRNWLLSNAHAESTRIKAVAAKQKNPCGSEGEVVNRKKTESVSGGLIHWSSLDLHENFWLIDWVDDVLNASTVHNGDIHRRLE